MGVFLATAMVQPNQLTGYSWLAKRMFCLTNRPLAKQEKRHETEQNYAVLSRTKQNAANDRGQPRLQRLADGSLILITNRWSSRPKLIQDVDAQGETINQALHNH